MSIAGAPTPGSLPSWLLVLYRSAWAATVCEEAILTSMLLTAYHMVHTHSTDA